MHRPAYVRWATSYLNHRADTEEAVDDAYLSGPHRDWAAHIDTVEQQTVPLPTDITGLIDHPPGHTRR